MFRRRDTKKDGQPVAKAGGDGDDDDDESSSLEVPSEEFILQEPDLALVTVEDSPSPPGGLRTVARPARRALDRPFGDRVATSALFEEEPVEGVFRRLSIPIPVNRELVLPNRGSSSKSLPKPKPKPPPPSLGEESESAFIKFLEDGKSEVDNLLVEEASVEDVLEVITAQRNRMKSVGRKLFEECCANNDAGNRETYKGWVADWQAWMRERKQELE